MMRHHITETYGDVQLSIIAGWAAYCTPRTDLPDLSGYTAVEIALLRGGLVSPESIGLPQFKDLFDPGDSPVAGYVDWAKVDEVRAALKERAAK